MNKKLLLVAMSCILLCFPFSLSAADFTDTIDSLSAFDVELISPYSIGYGHSLLAQGLTIQAAQIDIRFKYLGAMGGGGSILTNHFSAFNGSSLEEIGIFFGADNDWHIASLVIGPQFYDDIQNGLHCVIENPRTDYHEYYIIDWSRLNVSAVPIPGSVWLLGTGLLWLLGFPGFKRI